MYKKLLLNYYHNPVNCGVIENYSFATELVNFSCSDKVVFYVQVESDMIKNISYQGQGCIISQASASMFTEYIINKNFLFIENLTDRDMLKLIDLDLGPNRLKCVMLSLEAMKMGILKYKQDKIKTKI